MVGSGVIWAIVRRPGLWGEALRAVFALAGSGWWGRAPFLPVPEPNYAAWRRLTAYGDAAAAVDPDDVVAFLRWRRAFRRSSRDRWASRG